MSKLSRDQFVELLRRHYREAEAKGGEDRVVDTGLEVYRQVLEDLIDKLINGPKSRREPAEPPHQQ